MRSLIRQVRRLRASDVRIAIERRISEFRRGRSEAEIFEELCFCILAANYASARSWDIQKKVGRGFLTLPEAQLAKRLASLGHRFPNARARYIIQARERRQEIMAALASRISPAELRGWLADNVSGIGLKEASHFLRNIGRLEHAIVDFHIADVLARHGIMERPKTMTRRRYLEMEDALGRVARGCGMEQGELDMYLWYMETGKVLK